MRTDLTPGFLTAKDKTESTPLRLVRIDWPGINGLPALTVQLSERSLTLGASPWLALILSYEEGPGAAAATLRAWNGLADFGRGPERFSDLLRSYPPEAAAATVYRWFEGAGLTEADLAPLVAAKMTGPLEYDMEECVFRLTPLSVDLGGRTVGRRIQGNDYPNAPKAALGRIRPIVVGNVREAPAVRVRDVGKTRLTSVALPGASTLDVASTAGFPAAGVLVVNDDEVAYGGTTAAQFTGCTGINEFHYADDEVLEKVTDHRFLFSDPDYPISGITNIKVAGQLVAPADYTVDLTRGEVVFPRQPQRVRSVDTKFLQAQFDAVAPGNTALDAANAMQPNLRTQYAKISQASPLLKLQQTDTLAGIGQISRVLLRVEHFMEERLSLDSVTVRVSGMGDVGLLSPPGMDDQAVTSGTTDISHNHLDTFGFPIDIPQPPITPTTAADHVIEQVANGAGQFIFLSSGTTLHSINFPTLPTGALRAEYQVNISVVSGIFGTGTVNIQLDSRVVAAYNFSRFNWDYTGGFTINGSNQPGSLLFSVGSQGGQWTVDVISVKRLVFYPPNPAAAQAAQNTLKTGGTTGINLVPPLAAVTEKATRTVVDFFDLTTAVNGDWSWFTGREAEVEYTGAAEGRTVFLLHVAFEIEYARRRLAATDEVTADVAGVQDDAQGTMTGAAGALIEQPDHVFRWSLRGLLGLDASALDAVSFNAAGVALQAALPGGYRLAGVIQEKQEMRVLWDAWIRASRCRLQWDAAGQARLIFLPFNSSLNLSGQEVKTVDASRILLDPDTGKAQWRVRRTESSQISTRLDLPFGRAWENTAGAAHYRDLVSVQDPSLAALFGSRERVEGVPVDWCADAAQAQDLAGFYLAEFSQPQTWVDCAAVLEHLDLEPGDIVQFNAPGGNLSNLVAQVMDVRDRPGSRTAEGLEAVGLTLRLFPIADLVDSIAETVELAETSVLDMIWQGLWLETPQITETIAAAQVPGPWVEPAEALEGWTALDNLQVVEIVDIGETLAVQAGAAGFQETAQLTEAAFSGAFGGWTGQAWGFSGWGGKEVLA